MSPEVGAGGVGLDEGAIVCAWEIATKLTRTSKTEV